MGIAGIVGIGVSVTQNLNWWQSGLVTAGLMLVADLIWPVRHGKDLDIPGYPVWLRGFLPITLYIVGMGWILTRPPSIVNAVIGVGIAFIPTGWIIWEMEGGEVGFVWVLKTIR